MEDAGGWPSWDGEWLANPQKHARALGQTVWAQVVVSKILGALGPVSLGWGVADPLNHATPHVCYRIKYRR